MYDIGHSALTHTGPLPAPDDSEAVSAAQTEQPVSAQAQTAEAAPQAADAAAAVQQPRIAGMKVLLFKTPTCPNCKAAGALLDRAGVQYDALNANEEKDLVSEYGVKQAPTLVLVHGDTFEKYRGVSDIKGWLMKK